MLGTFRDFFRHSAYDDHTNTICHVPHYNTHACYRVLFGARNLMISGTEQNRTLYFDREVSVYIYKYVHICIYTFNV